MARAEFTRSMMSRTQHSCSLLSSSSKKSSNALSSCLSIPAEDLLNEL